MSSPPSADRKRMRGQIMKFPPVGGGNFCEQTPESLSEGERIRCQADGEAQLPKKPRFELGSPENPVLLEDSSEEGGQSAPALEIRPKNAEENPKAGPACTVTVVSSDEEMESEAAAVTVQKSVSQRVKKKKKSPAEAAALERRTSPRFQGRAEHEKPLYFVPGRPKPSASEVRDPGNGILQHFEQTDRVRSCDGAVQSEGAFCVTNRVSSEVTPPESPSSGAKEADSDGKFSKAGVAANLIPARETRSRAAAALAKLAANSTGGIAEEDSPSGVNSAPSIPAISDAARVKDTLRIFNAYFLQFVKEEEDRCKRVKETKNEKGSKNSKLKKGEDGSSESSKRSARRPDLKAVSKMMETNVILYPRKQFGHLPGINVGDHFFSRAEMVAIGFHSHWLNGIDFMGVHYSKMEEYKGYTFPLAVAIVLSGVYEDDVDNSEDVVYTGQGGNNLLGDKRQVKDQEMLRGNLALKNNLDQGVPVRVIRGHQSANSYSGKVYTYDGLYKVVQYWAEKGLSGYTVFKFRLRRLEGQPILTTDQVHFNRAQIPRCASDLRGLVCEDISEGQENIPVPASNVVDEPPVPPSGYAYSKTIKVGKGVNIPPAAEGCNCKGECINPRNCSCAKLNGADFPYVRRDGGRLVEAKDVVFECGPNCACGPGCVNRTSQQGLKYRLEVFRTLNKGWAVRSWDSIPAGAPVCEYTGILMRTDELDSVSENNFIFEIDCLQTMKGIDGRQRRLGDVSKHDDDQIEKLDDKKGDGQPEFCIDAGISGSVARFINHSCEPNLFVQCVLSSHHDVKLARVVLFAADNIPPLQELTYDYGYALDSVVGEDGKIKKMPCYCGAVGCRKRLY